MMLLIFIFWCFIVIPTMIIISVKIMRSHKRLFREIADMSKKFPLSDKSISQEDQIRREENGSEDLC